MRVFKFGGASVRDTESVKNLGKVLRAGGSENVFLVISAMGKTTNALEEVVRLYFEKGNYRDKISEIREKHLTIIRGIFQDPGEVICETDRIFEDLNVFLKRNKSPNYDFVYDQVVCCGELVSTRIVSGYLNSVGIQNTWMDVRDYIKTDDTYREGKVDWEKT